MIVAWAIAQVVRGCCAPSESAKRPTRKAGRKKKRKRGPAQKKNGKWSSSMFPGREFDDLDAYRAAKKQRARRAGGGARNASTAVPN